MTTATITEDHIRIAAQVLATCAANDPWFPQPNRATAIAWAEHIARWQIELPDAIEGVSKMYADNGSGFRPLPKDFSDAARSVRRLRTESEKPAEREAREDRRDALLEGRIAAVTADVFGGGFGKSIDA